MLSLPTIRVKNPKAPAGFMIINEIDRKPHHELYEGPEISAEALIEVAAIEPVEALIGARIVKLIVQQRLGLLPEQWDATLPVDRAALLEQLEAELASGGVAEIELPPEARNLTVGKGPRGKWFVSEDGRHLAGGYDTQAEAEAELQRQLAG